MPLHLPYYHGRIGGGARFYRGDSGVVYQDVPELLGYDIFTSRSIVHGTQDVRAEAYGTISNLSNAWTATAGLSVLSSYSIASTYLPGTTGIATTGNVYRWGDWGNDIFDNWGHWHVMNDTATAATPVNYGTAAEYQNTSSSTTSNVYNRFQGPDSKWFQVVKGYIGLGICRILITCEDPTYSFRVWMGGNMGSDSGTVRSVGSLANPNNPGTDWTGGTQPSDPELGWINDIGSPIHFVRNYQSVTTTTEQLHVWHLPIDRSSYLPNSATAPFTVYDGPSGASDDDFAILTDAYPLGHLLYFSKGINNHYNRVYFDVGAGILPTWNAYQ